MIGEYNDDLGKWFILWWGISALISDICACEPDQYTLNRAFINDTYISETREVKGDNGY